MANNEFEIAEYDEDYDYNLGFQAANLAKQRRRADELANRKVELKHFTSQALILWGLIPIISSKIRHTFKK